MKYSFLTACGFILLILLLGCGVFFLCLYLVFEARIFGHVPDTLQSVALIFGAPLAFFIFAGRWGALACSGRMLSPLTALITAPAVLLLAGGLRVFGAFFGSISGMPQPVLLEWGLSLGFSLFAGWLMPCKFAVPATWLRRYVPLLLLPSLLCLIVLSFYLVFVDPELGFWLQTIFPWAAGAWGLFVLGFLSGTRKAAPALERRHGLVVAAGLVPLTALIVGVNLYVATRNTLYSAPDVPEREIDWCDYEPDRSFGNRLVRPVRPPSLRIPGERPRLGGDRTLLPLYGAAAQAVCAGQCVDSLHDSYFVSDFIELLRRDSIDVAFVDMLAAQRLSASERTLGTLVLTPVASDALVFFVHKDNPVTQLRLEQVRDMFAGKIARWSEVGGRDVKPMVFQPCGARNERALADMVMRGQKTAPPLREEFWDAAEGSFVSGAAAYRNRPDAIGYGFLWQVVRQFSPDEIHILSIDGVAPTPETIRSGRYPLSVPLVAVSKTPVQKEAEVLLRWMCGPEGQDLISRAGYVPLSGPEENRTAP